MESIDVPTALECAFKEMIKNDYLKDLLCKLDKWLECSCEQVYHYNLRYHLDKLFPKSVSIEDEKMLNQIPSNRFIPEEYKKSKVDIYIRQGETEAFIEIKMGKMHKYSNFKKLYSKDISKLVEIKNAKDENCRCFLLKITHDICKKNKLTDEEGKPPYKYKHRYGLTYDRPYAEKVKILGEIYDNDIVSKFSDHRFKLNLIADSRNLENDVFIYHLWEIVEKE